MRVVIQRVSSASVSIGGAVYSSIKDGLLLFVGITHDDADEDVEWLAAKVASLRIFADENGVMNKSILETGGELLTVSQFTLHASTKKGNRPSYIAAARPEQAVPLYELFVAELAAQLGKEIKTGVFGADMQVQLLNDGPVTILMDSKAKE